MQAHRRACQDNKIMKTFICAAAFILSAWAQPAAEPGIRNAQGSAIENLPDGSIGRKSEYRSSDGTFLPAYLRRPAGTARVPVVVVVHGGPTDVEGTYSLGRSMDPPAAYFLAAGWAVLAIDYRPPSDPPKPLEREDAIAAIDDVRHLPFIDGKRVALLGGSRGGNVVSGVVSRVDVRCAVLCAPAVLDVIEISKAAARGEPVAKVLKSIVANNEKKYGVAMAEVEKNPAKYGYQSAFTQAATVRCPILIVSGRNDDSSPYAVAQAYATRLRAAGKETETYFPENGPHGFYFGHPSVIPETKEAAKRAVDFISKHFAE